MRSMLKRVALVVGLAGVVAAGTVPSAMAHNPTPSQYCPSSALCVWWNADYGGSRFDFFGDNATWDLWSIEDDDSSSYNHGTSGRKATIYQLNSGTGTRIVCLSMGAADGHHNPNDKGSSNKWPLSC